MAWRVALACFALLTAAVGCDRLGDVLPANALQCDGTELALCQAVARLAVSRMNLAATGPITHVTLTVGDCGRLARSSFIREAATGTACWQVDVVGERSYGGGAVVLQPGGALEAHWP